jgi:ribosome biogenesis GTPase
LIRGTIIKGISGFYYVKTGADVRTCKARGIFKKDGSIPLVGDEVTIRMREEDEGLVERILPRRNEFVRPPIANIDLFIAVVALANPSPNPEILDRFLVTAEAAGVNAVVCVNKTDLSGGRDYMETVYAPIYPTVFVSAKTGEGTERLRSLMHNRRVAFAGPSGVGKTCLIKRFVADEALITGEVSERTGRGRHTTRHVEIFDTDFGAAIYDTPGYTAFEGATSLAADARLDAYFPEIGFASEGCRFDDCRHMNEPGCAVTAALRDGLIAKSRYESYARLLSETERRTSEERRRKTK